MPALLIGLGTTGAKIVHAIATLLLAELGRLPKPCNWLAIDGAARESETDPRHFISTGVDGCGTLARKGRKAFLEEYSRIRYVIDQFIQRLSEYDPEVVIDHSPRDVLGAWIFAGCGGTSGGMFHPTISLLHDVARQRRIRQLRVYPVLLGADMLIRDSSRTVLREQRLVMSDTCASNLIKILADMTSSAVLQETRPDGSTFDLHAADRVWAPAVLDQSNGHFEWSLTDELVEMTARAYFLQIFTAVGKFLEDRDKDHRELGIHGHGTT